MRHALCHLLIRLPEPVRISPQEARQKVISGQALLVCAYGDVDKFKHNHLINKAVI